MLKRLIQEFVKRMVNNVFVSGYGKNPAGFLPSFAPRPDGLGAANIPQKDIIYHAFNRSEPTGYLFSWRATNSLLFLKKTNIMDTRNTFNDL